VECAQREKCSAGAFSTIVRENREEKREIREREERERRERERYR